MLRSDSSRSMEFGNCCTIRSTRLAPMRTTPACVLQASLTNFERVLTHDVMHIPHSTVWTHYASSQRDLSGLYVDNASLQQLEGLRYMLCYAQTGSCRSQPHCDSCVMKDIFCSSMVDYLNDTGPPPSQDSACMTTPHHLQFQNAIIGIGMQSLLRHAINHQELRNHFALVYANTPSQYTAKALHQQPLDDRTQSLRYVNDQT